MVVQLDDLGNPDWGLLENAWGCIAPRYSNISRAHLTIGV